MYQNQAWITFVFHSNKPENCENIPKLPMSRLTRDELELKGLSSAGKGLSKLILWIHVFCVTLKKNINWEHVEFDVGKSHLLPFFVVYHILSETEICPFVRLLLAWTVQRCNIRCTGILKQGLFRSSNKCELPWKMKRIWSKDWTELGSNRCVQIGQDDI